MSTRSIVSVLLAVSLLPAPVGSRAQRPSLTGAPELAAVYDAIFDARFGDVPQLLVEACGPRAAQPGEPAARAAGLPRSASVTRGQQAPDEACQLLDVVSRWWRIQLDPADTSRDAAFSARADATITAIDAWTTREASRAEAWFYLGAAYGVRAQWRVLRGERLAAARDGKRIKDALEQALALDASLTDAYFGIGLYHYYADVAPTAAKVVRWLLALPGGDRVEGLQEMLRARQGGQLLQGEADYQLHLIYLWYEKDPERALELLRGLRDEHPGNPHFPQLIAEIEDVYLQDHAASLRSWRALLDAAVARRVAEPAMSEVRARLGVAAELDRLFETDLAVEQLRAVASAKPTAPYGAAAQAQLQLAQALDRLGLRTEAVAAYRAALAGASDDLPGIADGARAGLRKRPDADAALAYRLSIEGWRALERGALAEASVALSRSLTLGPDDQVTRYRQARLLAAQKQDLQAIELFESVMGAGALTPATVYAAAAADAARLYEQQQATSRAIELYQRALDTDGVDERTRNFAARALARLTSGSAR